MIEDKIEYLIRNHIYYDQKHLVDALFCEDWIEERSILSSEEKLKNRIVGFNLEMIAYEKLKCIKNWFLISDKLHRILKEDLKEICVITFLSEDNSIWWGRKNDCPLLQDPVLIKIASNDEMWEKLK